MPARMNALPWLLLSVLVIVLDQFTKHVALVELQPYQPQTVIPGLLNWTLAFNPGAAFSFLAGEDGWQRWLFTALAIGVSAMLAFWLSRMNILRHSPYAQRQRGAVLFVALVFLILITLLALTATGASILQEKMTGGMRNRQLGLMGAETALRGGEAYLLNLDFIGGNQLTQCPQNGGAVSSCAFVPQADNSVDPPGIVLNPSVQSFRASHTWIPAPGGSPTYGHPLTGFTGDLETASLHAEPVLMSPRVKICCMQTDRGTR